MHDKVRILASLMLPGVGRTTVRRALSSGGDAAPDEEWIGSLGAGRHGPAAYQIALAGARRVLELCRREGIGTLLFDEPGYPRALDRLSDPPLLLYYRGVREALTAPKTLAIVGTRRPTRAGRQMSYDCARALARAEAVIVSGLALGCDAAAHEGALAAPGRTVACLPGGILRLYPPANRALAAQIVTRGGCLVSEYPPESPCEEYRFIERDRLQAGLASMTAVIETDPRGGAMHTARFTRECGARLCCWDGSGSSGRAVSREGNRRLRAAGHAEPFAGPKELERLFTAGPAPRPRLVFLGNLAAVAERLFARRDLVCAAWVTERGDDPDGRLRAMAGAADVPFYEVADREELDRVLSGLVPIDLGLAANFGLILRRRQLERARRGFMNVHLGLLPERPGRNPVRDALRAGERIVGVTLHEMTEAVDAGPTLALRRCPAGPSVDETMIRLERLAAALVEESLGRILGHPS